MRILALNASPRGAGQSKTQMMLDALVGGMRDAGGQVDVVQLSQKKINYCIGCYTCWTKTPGQCLHNDDMTHDLFPRWKSSDLVVYAFPLYHYTINAQMKTFIERTLPSMQPFFVQENGVTTHPNRHALPKAVVLSVAGFPEMPVFDLLSAYVRHLFGHFGRLVAEIYRPGAEMLSHLKADILSATFDAGRELVTQGRVAPETLQRIQQPAVDVQTLATAGNAFWKTCIAEKVTPKEFYAKNMIPRPDDLESFMHFFPHGINARAVQDRGVVLQFEFSGTVSGACRFEVADGRVQVHAGRAPHPDIVVETPFDLWMDIMTRKADGTQLYMEGKYQVHGDLNLLLQLLTKRKP